MESVKPTRTPRIPAQRHDLHEGSLTQARVDALFRALAARREYEERYTPEVNYDLLMEVYDTAMHRPPESGPRRRREPVAEATL